MTLRDYFRDTYLLYRLIGPHSRRTIEQYESAIRQYERFLGRPPLLTDLRDEVVAKFRQWLLDVRGNCVVTANKRFRHLAAIWKLAAEDHRAAVPRSCRLKEIRAPKRLPRAWTVNEIAKLLAECEKEAGIVGNGVLASDFFIAFTLLLYDTGLRMGAALQLRVDDVDQERRLVRVPAELQKTQFEHLSTYSEQTALALTRLLNEYTLPRERLFPWPFDENETTTFTAFNRRFGRIVDRAGIPRDNQLSHMLRKSRASYGELIEPMSSTRDLQHSSRAVTTGSYIDMTIVGVSKVPTLLPRPVVKSLEGTGVTP